MFFLEIAFNQLCFLSTDKKTLILVKLIGIEKPSLRNCLYLSDTIKRIEQNRTYHHTVVYSEVVGLD